ncbi:matrix metalloproteinase-2 [Wyeomyia smithii]|uniref:matrix metalloproteinase-2 n=1 Tax=Wyeomyia smithii TaxID=174621 RepID=UPI002468074B|nr:matrix metalloproteinase-2 [Wyeomyia smithii]
MQSMARGDKCGRIARPQRRDIFVLLHFGALLLSCCCVSGKPLENRHKSWDFDDNVQNYLMEFGYLPKSNIETGNLRTMDQLKEAVRQLQSFANLNPTGEINQETLALMRRPRCGAPDLPSSRDFLPSNTLNGVFEFQRHRRQRRFVIQGQKWEHPIVTWSLVNQSMVDLDAGQVRRVLHEALDLWAQNANLTFREVYSSEADIQVLFARQFHGDGYRFDGPGKILAHAFYPGTGIGGDAHFDEEETWLLNEPLGTDGTRLFDVAVHEFGHSLGLGHSSVKDAIMFPWHHVSYRGKDTIPEDDRLGIQGIYGPKKKTYGRNPERHTPATTTTTTTTTPAPPRRPSTKRYYPRKDHNGHPWEDLPPNVPVQPWKTTTTTEIPRRRVYYPDRPRGVGTDYPTPRVHHEERPYTREPDTEAPHHIPTPTKIHHHHHHHHHPRTQHPATRPPLPRVPNPCDTSYDAITLIRNELFIFKDRYLWRIFENDVQNRPPIEIDRMFFGLPKDFERIDSVYENKHQKILFFIGKQYYVFNSQHLEPGYPKPLTHLGLPESIERIDAALVWSYNNRTYLYSGRLYWRFDEDTNHVELDYPRDMSMWKGVGYNIDSAFQNRDGKTYFFKGKGYWRFNDLRMSVDHADPHSSAHKWMKCQREPIIDTTTEEMQVSAACTLVRWNFAHSFVLALLVVISLNGALGETLM